MKNTKNDNKKDELARDLIAYAKDEIIVSYAFFGVVFAGMQTQWEENGDIGLWGAGFRFSKDRVCENFFREEYRLQRILLHGLLHYIFCHNRSQKKTEKLWKRGWNLATDIAVESVILELREDDFPLEDDGVRSSILEDLKREISLFTPERIYAYLRKKYDLTLQELEGKQSDTKNLKLAELEKIFCMDSHEGWYLRETSEAEIKNRKRIATKVKTDLETFSKERKKEGMMLHLREAVKERQSYRELLLKFAMPTEEKRLSPEEIDFVYYHYGLSLFKNIPLIEPLEYSEENKIRDFVIAIDTSGSTAGTLVQKFLDKTYSILKTTESFAEEINVHVLQCDDRIRKDTKVTSREEMDAYIKKLRMEGFGGTDFRPVFEYVQELQAKRELTNLKGLIYFTDGRGIFPKNWPGYSTAFVFVEQGILPPVVPPWAIRMVIESEELEGETE